MNRGRVPRSPTDDFTVALHRHLGHQPLYGVGYNLNYPSVLLYSTSMLARLTPSKAQPSQSFAQLRDTLLPELFSGKLRILDTEMWMRR